MVLASLGRKIQALLHGFFRPAKKPMHFLHGSLLHGCMCFLLMDKEIIASMNLCLIVVY
jgi:hypothetical protein